MVLELVLPGAYLGTFGFQYEMTQNGDEVQRTKRCVIPHERNGISDSFFFFFNETASIKLEFIWKEKVKANQTTVLVSHLTAKSSYGRKIRL